MNPTHFSDYERRITYEAVQSDHTFTIEEIKVLAQTGMLSKETAQKSIEDLRNAAIPKEREFKQDVFHKKVLLRTAFEAHDPRYDRILELSKRQHNLYSELEAEYGEKARIFEDGLIDKVLETLKGEHPVIAEKFVEFQ
jgi:hypothetical protein